jgi:hypothetical protein
VACAKFLVQADSTIQQFNGSTIQLWLRLRRGRVHPWLSSSSLRHSETAKKVAQLEKTFMHSHNMKSLHRILTLLTILWPAVAAVSAPVRVLVWDEQQPAQKQAYTNFLGNELAGYLARQPGLVVKAARLDDPEQGLGQGALDDCDVLVWWGTFAMAR